MVSREWEEPRYWNAIYSFVKYLPVTEMRPNLLYQREELEFQGWFFQGQWFEAGVEKLWTSARGGWAAAGTSLLASYIQIVAAIRAHSNERSLKEGSAGRDRFLNP